MSNIWLLTEECPKPNTLSLILELFSNDFGHPIQDVSKLKIQPIYDTNKNFTFEYELLNIKIKDVERIILCCASGYSSFCDYLLFYQKDKPKEKGHDIPLMIIEETKTFDKESRNVGIHQRGIKFVYSKHFYPDTKKYMIYCNDYNPDHNNPTKTNIFGTKIYKNLGIQIHGRDTSSDVFNGFKDYQELIDYKNKMPKTVNGITTKIDDSNPKFLKISVKLVKDGNMSHDPGTGTVAVIASGLRTLGYKNPIIITNHGITQEMMNRARGNKLLYICKMLNVSLEGITMRNIEYPKYYWHYEKKSEKVTSIFLHIIAVNHGLTPIFHNHAGCEKCYFISNTKSGIPIEKATYLPDVIFYDSSNNLLTIIEGKRYDTLDNGIKKLNGYGKIENDYLLNKSIGYPNCKIYRALTIFGNNDTDIPHDSVLLYMRQDGQIHFNKNMPKHWKDIFKKEGFNIN